MNAKAKPECTKILKFKKETVRRLATDSVKTNSDVVILWFKTGGGEFCTQESYRLFDL
jgi:hypothetical protein